MTSIIVPLEHQKETISRVNEALKEGKTKQLIVLPSGAGKTHTIAFDVKQRRPVSFLYIVHRNEILEQSKAIFLDICKDFMNAQNTGILNQKNKDYNKPYLFASVLTLCRQKHLERLSPKYFNYIVLDEYHHVAANSYEKIMDHFQPLLFIGLTATPYRLDDKDITSKINTTYSMDLFEGIENNILCPFQYLGLYDDIDYSQIRFSGYRYNKGDLDRKLVIHKRDQAVLDNYKELVRDRKATIAFCNSVHHVRRCVSLFLKAGIRAVGLTWKDPPELRRQIIKDFKTGLYDVLFTRDILNEGVDFPECEAIMFLRPTISKTVFFQQLGRGLRKKIGKSNVLVLDYIGNYNRAFEKRKWFGMFSQVQHSGNMIKPLYEHDPRKPLVVFDKRVVEIMDIQEKHYQTYTAPGTRFTTNKQELIDNYYRVKEYWEKNSSGFEKKQVNQFYAFSGKNIPPKKLLYDKNVSKYSLWSYFNVWGNFVKFLEEIKEVEITDITITRWDSKEAVLTKLTTMAEKLQKKLDRSYFNYADWFKEYKTNGMSHMNTLYGGFTEFKKHFGYPLQYKTTCPVCGKEKLSQRINRKNVSFTCSIRCSNIYFNTTPRALEEISLSRKKKLDEIIPCGYCKNPIHKYSFDNKNNRLQRFKFCSIQCTQRYHKTDGGKRPLMTPEEVRAKRAEGIKKRWAGYENKKKKKSG